MRQDATSTKKQPGSHWQLLPPRTRSSITAKIQRQALGAGAGASAGAGGAVSAAGAGAPYEPQPDEPQPDEPQPDGAQQDAAGAQQVAAGAQQVVRGAQHEDCWPQHEEPQLRVLQHLVRQHLCLQQRFPASTSETLTA